MAPLPDIDDYYATLGVEESATSSQIAKAYKSLALKLHPDKNSGPNATQEFQLLGQAYETLRDEDKRLVYDELYSTIAKKPRPPTTETPEAPRVNTEAEEAEITKLEKSKREREARWQPRKEKFDAEISELQTRIRQKAREIKDLHDILSAVGTEEAKTKRWIFYEKPEEQQNRQDRERQETRMEITVKEGLLAKDQAALDKKRVLLDKAKKTFDDANFASDQKIEAVRARIAAKNDPKKRAEHARRKEKERRQREREEQWEKEREEREWEKRAKEARKRQEAREQLEREAEEERLKKEESERKAQKERQRQQKEEKRKREAEQKLSLAERVRKREQAWEATMQQIRNEHGEQDPAKLAAELLEQERQEGIRRTQAEYNCSVEDCDHGGYWSTVYGFDTCQECGEAWDFLLRCPGCEIEVCPRCQKKLRPSRWENAW